MKKYIPIFAVSFALFFVAGLVRGCGGRTNTAVLAVMILKRTEVVPHDNGIFLEFGSDPTVWRFDVDTNEPEFLDLTDPVKHLYGPYDNISSDATLALLGAAGWKLKDVIAVSSLHKRDVRSIVVSVIGGLSGYLAGYYVGSVCKLDDTNPAIIKILRTPEQFKLEDLVARLHYAKTKALETEVYKQRIFEETAKRPGFWKRQKTFHERAQKTDHDFSREDFQYLLDWRALVAHVIGLP